MTGREPIADHLERLARWLDNKVDQGKIGNTLWSEDLRAMAADLRRDDFPADQSRNEERALARSVHEAARHLNVAMSNAAAAWLKVELQVDEFRDTGTVARCEILVHVRTELSG